MVGMPYLGEILSVGAALFWAVGVVLYVAGSLWAGKARSGSLSMASPHRLRELRPKTPNGSSQRAPPRFAPSSPSIGRTNRRSPPYAGIWTGSPWPSNCPPLASMCWLLPKSTAI